MAKNRVIYLQIKKNNLTMTEIGKKLKISKDLDFSTDRLLIANYTMVENELLKIIKKYDTNYKSLWIRPHLTIVIHPIEIVDSILCEVEEKVFEELADAIGANKTVIHRGNILTDNELRMMI